MGLNLNLFLNLWLFSCNTGVFVGYPCLPLITMFYWFLWKRFTNCGNMPQVYIYISTYFNLVTLFLLLSRNYVLLITASCKLSVKYFKYLVHWLFLVQSSRCVCENTYTCACGCYVSEGLSSALIFQVLREYS